MICTCMSVLSRKSAEGGVVVVGETKESWLERNLDHWAGKQRCHTPHRTSFRPMVTSQAAPATLAESGQDAFLGES